MQKKQNNYNLLTKHCSKKKFIKLLANIKIIIDKCSINYKINNKRTHTLLFLKCNSYFKSFFKNMFPDLKKIQTLFLFFSSRSIL